MADPLPCLILTGASGIVGRNFLDEARERFCIYALARRSQQRAGVPKHPNIHWLQVDIGVREALETVMGHIKKQHQPDFLVHLAAHYDFDNIELPDYQHTNIDGTRNVLDQARVLGVRHVIFASSIAACEFPPAGGVVTEETPPLAEYPYARSKRVGEQMMREYSQDFHCSVVRFAAVISDWCEYAPLYVFLRTWLSKRWNARILGGRGTSAVPYIHARDINRILFRLLDRTGELPSPAIYLASPDGATSHRELFDLATRFQFRHEVHPHQIPKPLAWTGILARDLLGRMVGRRPFERLWMIEYLDRSLTVDASKTRSVLDWAPTPRLHVLRRLLFLIEKMKSSPNEWVFRNERAMKRPVVRPSLVVHTAMVRARDTILDTVVSYLQSPTRLDRFANYAAMSPDELRWFVGVVYDLLTAAVRTGDRELLLTYIQDLARLRYAGGFPQLEVCDALLAIRDIAVDELLTKPEMAEVQDTVLDSISLSTALAVDGVQDAFDSLQEEAGEAFATDPERLEGEFEELESIVERLNAFYRPLRNGD